MKKAILSLLLLCMASTPYAQSLRSGEHHSETKVSRTYRDVSMSEVLRDLNEASNDYTVNFMYNELEDFRVTTEIRRKSIPDAIQQSIGFYPIRMVQRGENELYVECTHKTERHLTGTIIDENRQPVAYANVYLLHPSDSTVIGGGVSNEAGVFVIPYEVPLVLIRVSYVGYKTTYRLSRDEQVGTIQIKPETQAINGVVVRGERPKIQMQGNSLVMNVEGTVMERMGTAEDVLSRVPTISKKGDAFEILGKGVPLIYLNSRKLTSFQELRNIQSDNIKNVEVIQNPGARYDASVKAVIIIQTKRVAGEGLGVELTSWSRKGHGYANNERINLTYRSGGLELFANLFGAYNKRWERSGFEQTVFADTLWTITNRHQSTARNPYFEGRVGFNYQIDDETSFGGFYQHVYDYVKTSNENVDDLLADGTTYDHLHNSGTRRDTNAPKHQASFYYTSKMGQFSIDFNADYTAYKNQSRNQQQELSVNYENRDVNTETQTRGRMAAEKLIVSHPLWKGHIAVGEEYTNTHWRSSFENREGYIANSSSEQHESNMAPFLELRQQLGRFKLQAGLRYEHVTSEYFVGGQRRDDQCRTYDDLFPSVALSTAVQKVQLSLSYAKRTNRPAYWLLNNDVVYENRLNMQTGNPYLRPVKYHNLNAMAMWKGFYLNTNLVHCVNPFLQVVENMEQDSKVNIATIKNYDHANWFIITLGAQRDVRLGTNITWTPQYNVTLMKQWLTTTFNGQEINHNQPQLSLQLGNIVTLPHDWLLQADFSMHTHGYTGSNFRIETTNAMLSLSVSKDLFKRRFNIKLSANDLFDQGSGYGTFYFSRMKMTKSEDNDTRYVSLSLRYRFNVTPSRYKGTGAGNAEKNRL
ncbi:MAG: TonB-dependent receptor [Prevotella sp.]|nr:TonB-dependent receptor [Prevotella sp.]